LRPAALVLAALVFMAAGVQVLLRRLLPETASAHSLQARLLLRRLLSEAAAAHPLQARLLLRRLPAQMLPAADPAVQLSLVQMLPAYSGGRGIVFRSVIAVIVSCSDGTIVFFSDGSVSNGVGAGGRGRSVNQVITS
jgi:hypothetical protein